MQERMSEILITVPGPCATKGSMRYVGHRRGRPILKHDAKRYGPWSRIAALFVNEGMQGHKCVDAGAVKVSITFLFVRPQSHWKADGDTLATKAPADMTVKPDIDKCIRACLDAMTGRVYRDDAQVTHLDIVKVYGPEAKTIILVRQETP